MVYDLKRESDGKGEVGKVSVLITYDKFENPTFNHNERPKVDAHIGVGSIFDMWQTSLITEILEDEKNRVKFKTENSIYVWSLK